MRVSFALAYRCTFGQHLCVVGSIHPLGAWDVRQGVAMRWQEGDICAPCASLLPHLTCTPLSRHLLQIIEWHSVLI